MHVVRELRRLARHRQQRRDVRDVEDSGRGGRPCGRARHQEDRRDPAQSSRDGATEEEEAALRRPKPPHTASFVG